LDILFDFGCDVTFAFSRISIESQKSRSHGAAFFCFDITRTLKVTPALKTDRKNSHFAAYFEFRRHLKLR